MKLEGMRNSICDLTPATAIAIILEQRRERMEFTIATSKRNYTKAQKTRINKSVKKKEAFRDLAASLDEDKLRELLKKRFGDDSVPEANAD